MKKIRTLGLRFEDFSAFGRKEALTASVSHERWTNTAYCGYAYADTAQITFTSVSMATDSDLQRPAPRHYSLLYENLTPGLVLRPGFEIGIACSNALYRGEI